MKTNLLVLLGIALFLSISCTSNRAQKYFRVDHVIMPVDTLSNGGKIPQIMRQDYFMIETNIADTSILKGEITKYIEHDTTKNYLKYDYYVMYFFRSTSAFNTNTVYQYSYQQRYKAFFPPKAIFTYEWANGKIDEIKNDFEGE